MINKALFTNNSDAWTTPQNLFNKLNKEFNFTLDVCASKKNTKCKKYFTEKDNALLQDWSNHICFMNPPYSRIQDKLIAKAKEESDKRATVVCLLPARTDTKRFHTYIWNQDTNKPRDRVEIRFIKGRLIFGNQQYWEWVWKQKEIGGKKNSLYKQYGKKEFCSISKHDRDF
jgi:site-specific DNA-methyltransferase (adenine-specific)